MRYANTHRALLSDLYCIDALSAESDTQVLTGGWKGRAVVLSTENQINLDAIKAICSLPDDLYRLRWVSYAYYDIHKRLAKKFGANASWPAFARWSAYTISEALRRGQGNPPLTAALRYH